MRINKKAKLKVFARDFARKGYREEADIVNRNRKKIDFVDKMPTNIPDDNYNEVGEERGSFIYTTGYENSGGEFEIFVNRGMSISQQKKTLFHEARHIIDLNKKHLFTRSAVGREYKAHNADREYRGLEPLDPQEFFKRIWKPGYQQTIPLPK